MGILIFFCEGEVDFFYFLKRRIWLVCTNVYRIPQIQKKNGKCTQSSQCFAGKETKFCDVLFKHLND